MSTPHPPASTRAQSEMGLLSQRLEMAGDTKAEGELAALPGSRLGLHVSMAMMALAVWWFYTQEHAAVQRKLTFSILFPVRGGVWARRRVWDGPRFMRRPRLDEIFPCSSCGSTPRRSTPRPRWPRAASTAPAGS